MTPIIITTMSVAEQVARLREQVERANNAYGVQALHATEISDASATVSAEELQALEGVHPGIQSPALRVGAVACKQIN